MKCAVSVQLSTPGKIGGAGASLPLHLMKFKRGNRVRVISANVNGAILSGDNARKEYLVEVDEPVAGYNTWVFKEDDLRPA